ncbi:MAG: hypothetical protein MZV49_22590 [Rhodopseudomonas palustris]|nr:hypothetical protein [Rhodopseudomonas palustris]
MALIAFRGQGAEVILPPTRSLVRAKRSLAGLPGGGGTPLAAGSMQALLLLAQAEQRRGHTPVAVHADRRPRQCRARRRAGPGGRRGRCAGRGARSCGRPN